MEQYCGCEYFEEKGISHEEIFKKFTHLASSEFQNGKYSNNGKFTSLLKCPNCNSYYLINRSNSLGSEKTVLPIIKYYSKVDEKILIKTVKSLEGVIDNKELDECCDLSLTVINILDKHKKR